MTDKIKVLHIVAGSLNGGAARGAYWLHQGLIKQGIQSKMLINSPDTFGDPNIETVVKSKRDKLKHLVYRQIDGAPIRFYRNRSNYIFSTGMGGIDITKQPLYNWADIIQLHWINGGFVNIKPLRKVTKPIIWTLRDMWPLTGGCHYAMACDKFKTGCGSCPQLGSKRTFYLSKIVLNRKRKYLPSTIKLVGISPWLTATAKESELFKHFEAQTIFNNVNCDEFIPVEKKIARDILGIRTTKKIILVGAQNINNFYKGFDLFIKSLDRLDKKKYHLAFFGKLDAETAATFGFTYTNFGFLNDTISLRLLYSAADVFVAPSIQEAFGKTIVEAMACGTPVVCFDATGPKDIVDHKTNGYKAVAFDSYDLSKGVEWVVNNNETQNLNAQARQKAVEVFDSTVIAKQYEDLYNLLA